MASTTPWRRMPPTSVSVESATDVAKEAADIVLLDKDLGVLADGVMEGQRIFANTLKYVLMATSSNFGNMFSAAGASLFLSFLPMLPMLPSQILLNDLLYDVGQLAIPTDRVDAEVLRRLAGWDIAFVRRFMAVFGPVSSLFDFMTFWVMLVVLDAGHREFPHGLVRRVARHADSRRLRHPHPPRAVPAQPTEQSDDRAADRVRGDRGDPALHPGRAPARLRAAPARVLPHPHRTGRCVPPARRGRQGPLLCARGSAASRAAEACRTPAPPHPPARRSLRPPRRRCDLAVR
jgi:hypothetical protein